MIEAEVDSVEEEAAGSIEEVAVWVVAVDERFSSSRSHTKCQSLQICTSSHLQRT